MRWSSGVACKCGGVYEVYESDDGEPERPIYLYVCSHCDLGGNWGHLARQKVGSRGFQGKSKGASAGRFGRK